METTLDNKKFLGPSVSLLFRQRDLLGGRQGLTEVGELLPWSGQVELPVLLRQLNWLLDNSLQLIVVAILEFEVIRLNSLKGKYEGEVLTVRGAQLAGHRDPQVLSHFVKRQHNCNCPKSLATVFLNWISDILNPA